MDRSLEIMSLKKAVGFTLNESQQAVRGNNTENDAKLKSEIEDLWFFFKQVIGRQKYGRKAIRLIQVLSYLGGNEKIDYGLVDWEYRYKKSHNYDYGSKEIFNVLDLLESYGLIRLMSEQTEYFAFESLFITLPNDIWMSVVREKNGKNPNLEIQLLRTCIEMVENGTYSLNILRDQFRAICPHFLKHPVLVKEFKTFFLRNLYEWNVHLMADISETFEKIFGQSDHETMELRSWHLQMMFQYAEPKNEILLAKCEDARVIFEGKRRYDNWRDWQIAETIYCIGYQSEDLEWRDIFYEESLRWYKMMHARLPLVGLKDDELSEYWLKKCIKTTVKILVQLDRSKDIFDFDFFRELRNKIISGKERILCEESGFSVFDFDSKLSSMIELILKFKNSTLKTHLIEELLHISEIAFSIVLNTQKENIKSRNMKTYTNLPKIATNLIKCLIEFGRFDQILSVIKQTDLVWQESTQNRYCGVAYDFYHLNVHKQILKICIENQVLKNNVKLRNSFLKQSVSTIMPICVFPSTVRHLYLPHYEYSCMDVVVGRCLIELNEMNELIIFINNVENLMDSTPKNDNKMQIKTSEGMINFCEMIVKCLTPLNGRVELLQVLEKTLQITKKFLSEGLAKGLGPAYEKIAQNIIKVCESNLED